jgi:RNA polymerase sigma-70 factor, ECF subfamily
MDRVMANTARKHQQESSNSAALSGLSDEELVTAHLEGRPGAFQELFGRYRDRLVHFITRKTGDPDRAQDLVQEAFIRVTRHLHRFDTEKKFSTWVYTIASNLSKNELRNRSRSPLVLFQKLTSNWDDDHRPLQFEDVSMRPDDLYRKRYLQRLVEDTVEELPSTTAWSSGCGSWTGRATRRSRRSPA